VFRLYVIVTSVRRSEIESILPLSA
jgi:hypothetical protein